MAATAAKASTFSFGPLPLARAKPSSSSICSVKPLISLCTPAGFSITGSSSLLPPFPLPAKRRARCGFLRCSAVQDVAVEPETAAAAVEEEEIGEKRRKVYVVNLPWDFSAPDIEKLFAQCGTVKDVEIIKQKNGKSRGFAFVTMASGEEARAAVDKLDAYELTGRIIRVEYAKSFRKPPPSPPPGAVASEPRHKIYVSNLAWKARSVNLKEFFEKFKPLSARVVFENPTGRSAGYGFVGFATKEEAEAAISELDGKVELLGRPVRLRISQRTEDKSESEPGDSDSTNELSNDS
ncbi:hypothetical protein C4D60_Mb11t20830 [Musa balbisiana]|uniref:RRM domain-containing protein n=1 Tax=Musa balbisiana TaxID=52838 RepID=A0A4S8J829_MUSBA|nr:hypothetical protein C4D60_Mb11t20830 [Musa balbisiana]